MTGREEDDHTDWQLWLDPDARRPLPEVDRHHHVAAAGAALGGAVEHGRTSALLVTGSANLRWLTGFTGSNGAALVLPDEVVLFTDPRYEGRAAVECHGIDVVVCRPLLVEAVGRAGAVGVDALLFESEHVSHRVATEIVAAASEDPGIGSSVPTVGLLERERTTKGPAELARLARACAVTEAVLDEVLASGLVGRTEREVARLVEDGLREREAAVGFPTIVAAGANGAVPHHEPTTRLIDDGELVTVDCGARIDGYHADTTRTVAAGSRPRGDGGVDLCDVFDAVAAAQQRGVEAVTAGVTGGDVDRASRDLLDEAGYGEQFVHGTGHGVGLEIHEAPAVSATASDSLAACTPLTVEPGVYVPGCGGVRVEDTVVTMADGPAVRLTTAPRTLLVV